MASPRSVVSGYWKRQATTACSIFFRSKAYCYDALLGAWQNYVVNQGKAVQVAERLVLLGDHTSVVKDGRKMPGVVAMHEDSETQSKPSYFRGQCWGAIGVLTGTLAHCFCCPLQLQIHQGFAHLGLTDQPGSEPLPKSTVRMVAMAVNFAESHRLPCRLVLDAFFCAFSVFKTSQYYSIEHKKPWVEILTKAKSNTVAYFPAPPKPAGRRGRQAFYGEKVQLWECFDYPTLFETVTCQVYGKTETVLVMSLTLLWRPIADYVLFILVVSSRGAMILMSSDLELSAVNAIELYCARTRIEILFSVLKGVIGAFKFRFWTKKLPKHSRSPVPNSELKAPHPKHLRAVQACWQAYETFVLCAAIAVGLLQFIALNFQDTIWSEHCLYLRTQSRDLPSEKTVKQIIAPLLIKQFFRHGRNGIIQQIHFYFMTISDEIDDN